MKFFLQHKIIILRSLGAVMLIVGIAIHFWVTPKEGLSENDKAAARIARMEASAKGQSKSNPKSQEKDTAKLLESLKETQAKQLEYLTVLAMLFGVGFVGYSFMPKRKD